MCPRRRKGKWWYRGYAIQYWEGEEDWRAQIVEAPEFVPLSADKREQVRANAERTIDTLIAEGWLNPFIGRGRFTGDPSIPAYVH
jgi:hypothetical protein